MSPKETAYIVERLAVRFMAMVADYERKLVEHRDSFGARTSADAKIIEGLRRELFMLTGLNDKLIVDREEAWKERDGLLTQVQDQRAEIERLRIEAAKCKAERDDLYQREGIGQKRRMDVEDERDALRAEVEFLKTLRPKYKVGDKLQLYTAIRYTPVNVVGVRTVYDCQADGAEYPVGHSEDELTERYEQTPPEATHAEPDLTQLHAKGKEAWSDVPNATQWVEEMRGNSEATHDTVQGKAAAEAVVRDSGKIELLSWHCPQCKRTVSSRQSMTFCPSCAGKLEGVSCVPVASAKEPVAEEIKRGDLIEVVSNNGRNTWLADVGSVGTVTSIETVDDSPSVRLEDVPGKKNVLAGYVSLCDVRKVTT